MNNLCPFCEKGTTHTSTRVESITHGDKTLSVHGYQVSTCDACSEEMVTSEQARANQKLIADTILSEDGKLLTGDLKCFRLRHGLSQTDSALIFGGGQNAFSKYERGEVQQSKSMDLLVRVYDNCADARDYLIRRSGVNHQSKWVNDIRIETRVLNVQPRPSTLRVSESISSWEDLEPCAVSR